MYCKVAAKGQDLWKEINLKPILNIALMCDDDDDARADVAEPKAFCLHELSHWSSDLFPLFYKNTLNTK